jgi:cellulose synthase (UDP-forming)
MVIAAQPVGLDAQFTFGFCGLAVMLVLRAANLRGPLLHVFMAIAAAIVFRYMYWRLTSTIPPISHPVDFTFGILLFAAELYSVSMLVLSLFLVSDQVKRAPAPLEGDPSQWPTVDVYVPSYNEDLEIVGMTLAAAKNLDYPSDRLNVYLLDDGGTDQKCNDINPEKASAAKARRAEMQAFCKALGVGYLTRAKNISAKAGNMNAAMEHTNGDLIVVFDADHTPTQDFLQQTIGYFQRDPKLFLVQTPHFFLNPDPIEKNLQTFNRMPSENEMFYSVVQRGLDKWNGTFFCGSAAVLRREALELTNGFSGQSITEDCETALELHTRGWNSLYVNRAMIAGLQPETFESFIGQRSRWCQGMLQILVLKRPMFRKGLSASQRLAYTSNPLFWLFPFSRLIFMFAPILYVFFDLQIYNASFQEFLAYTLVFLISNTLLQSHVYGRVRWPWVSEIYEYVQSVYLMKASISVLLNPRAPSFNVTAKGETLEKRHLSSLAMPYFVMFTLLAATTIWAIQRLTIEGVANELLLIVTLWSVFNLCIAGVALGVVSERPERRKFHRMATWQPAELCVGDAVYDVTIDDCSTGGLRVRPSSGRIAFGKAADGDAMSLKVKDGDGTVHDLSVSLRSSSSDAQGTIYGLSFLGLKEQHLRLIARLLYPNHQVLETIRRRRHSGRTISLGTVEVVFWAFLHTARGWTYLARSLTERSKPAVTPNKEAASTPLIGRVQEEAEAVLVAATPAKAPALSWGWSGTAGTATMTLPIQGSEQ